MGDDRDGSDTSTVQCRTDLSTCCDGRQLSPRGDWFFPNGTRLPLFNESSDIRESLQPQVVHIRRFNNAIGPSGIYRCFIGTNAVHDNNDPSVGETAYVGLYHNGGGTLYVIISMLWKIVFSSDLYVTLRHLAVYQSVCRRSNVGMESVKNDVIGLQKAS